MSCGISLPTRAGTSQDLPFFLGIARGLSRIASGPSGIRSIVLVNRVNWLAVIDDIPEQNAQIACIHHSPLFV